MQKIYSQTLKSNKLGIIADKLGIEVLVAHRALDDVDTTVKVFRVMLNMLEEKGAKTIEDIDKLAGWKRKLQEVKELPCNNSCYKLCRIKKLIQVNLNIITWITYIKADQCY